jgi:DNA-binding NarL/FixJ family response regulator
MLVCEGLRLMIADDEDLEVVGIAQDVDEAIYLISQTQPDVIILSPFENDCISSIKCLQSDRPSLSVLVVVPRIHPAHVQAVLQAGATGVLTMDATIDELLRAVYTVGRGELTIHPTIVRELLPYLSDKKTESPHPRLEDLSPREQEVLSYLTRGLSDRDIAQALFISVRTVQTHLSHIYAKLEVHSRIEAALIAVQEGWFSAPGSDFVDSKNQ